MPMLTEAECELAIRYYGFGWSFQEITARLLDLRNEKAESEMVREVGILVSTHYNRKAYPTGYYRRDSEE